MRCHVPFVVTHVQRGMFVIIKWVFSLFLLLIDRLSFFFVFLFCVKQDQCCWSCVKCREDAYVHNDTCMVCDPGWAPNDLKNGCDKLTPEVIDWLSPWALVPIIFSSIGILFTLFTTAVFIK